MRHANSSTWPSPPHAVRSAHGAPRRSRHGRAPCSRSPGGSRNTTRTFCRSCRRGKAKHAQAFMALLTKEQGKPRAGAEWEIVGSAIWRREIAKQKLDNEILEDSPE